MQVGEVVADRFQIECEVGGGGMGAIFARFESSAQPLLLVLDDLHWGDLPSVNLTAAALERLSDVPLMVLALARPELRDTFPDLWSEHGPLAVGLPALNRKASERVATSVLGDSTQSDVVERLVQQAAGNAFFLEELIRTVRRRSGFLTLPANARLLALADEFAPETTASRSSVAPPPRARVRPCAK